MTILCKDVYDDDHNDDGAKSPSADRKYHVTRLVYPILLRGGQCHWKGVPGHVGKLVNP